MNTFYAVRMLIPHAHWSRGDVVPEMPGGAAHMYVMRGVAEIIAKNGVPIEQPPVKRGPGRPKKILD